MYCIIDSMSCSESFYDLSFDKKNNRMSEAILRGYILAFQLHTNKDEPPREYHFPKDKISRLRRMHWE